MPTKMKTVRIHNKQYVEVNERLLYFREHFAGYGLLTKIIELTPDTATIQATIINDQGREVASGVAHEVRTSSKINQSSYVENCETSAWGRALANFGIGIEASVCSADELVIALEAQNSKPEKRSVDPRSNDNTLSDEMRASIIEDDTVEGAKIINDTEELEAVIQDTIQPHLDKHENDVARRNSWLKNVEEWKKLIDPSQHQQLFGWFNSYMKS